MTESFSGHAPAAQEDEVGEELQPQISPESSRETLASSPLLATCLPSPCAREGFGPGRSEAIPVVGSDGRYESQS